MIQFEITIENTGEIFRCTTEVNVLEAMEKSLFTLGHLATLPWRVVRVVLAGAGGLGAGGTLLLAVTGGHLPWGVAPFVSSRLL